MLWWKVPTNGATRSGNARLTASTSVDEADFVYIKNVTNSTAGNLSAQIEKLRLAGYIDVKKSFQGKKPHTSCRITPLGKEEFFIYVDSITDYLKIKS